MVKKLAVFLVPVVLSLPGLVACDDDNGAKDGSGGGSIEQVCRDECAQEERCQPDEFALDYNSQEECRGECATYGTMMRSELSTSCFNALLALYSCTSKLSCDKLDEYWEEPTPNYPCAQYDQASEQACAAEFDDWGGY